MCTCVCVCVYLCDNCLYEVRLTDKSLIAPLLQPPNSSEEVLTQMHLNPLHLTWAISCNTCNNMHLAQSIHQKSSELLILRGELLEQAPWRVYQFWKNNSETAGSLLSKHQVCVISFLFGRNTWDKKIKAFGILLFFYMWSYWVMYYQHCLSAVLLSREPWTGLNIWVLGLFSSHINVFVTQLLVASFSPCYETTKANIG